MPTSVPLPTWLLLVHQLPPKPTSVRVKTWRRLQALGAVAIKNSVYVLPHSPRTREDLEWLRTEILALGGEATIFEADSPADLGRDELVGVFHRAREQDYRRLDADLERLRAKSAGRAAQRAGPRLALARALRALRRHCEEIERVDFFTCPAGRTTARTLAALERALERPALAIQDAPRMQLLATAYQGRKWVTRPLPGVDRMASAWLIRRFLDATAGFVFARAASDEPAAIAFDMFGAEFSHQGDGCTFETLIERFGLRERALSQIAEIVHDCDLHDHRYGATEAGAIERLVEGLRFAAPDDRTLLESGITMFEALYRSFAAAGAEAPAAAKRRRSPTRAQAAKKAKKAASRRGR